MKIAYVTVEFPYGPHETFFASEVRELMALGHDVVVIPTRPLAATIPYRSFAARVLRLPLFGLRTLRLALAAFASQPVAAVSAAAGIAVAPTDLRTKCKNLAVFPKALAVAWEVRRLGIQHIHALWLSTPATVAYVASALTGVPWSCSAHRFDVFTNNLLRPKLASATFVRAISSNTRRLLVERAGADLSDRCYVVHLGVNVPQDPRAPGQMRVLQMLCPAQLVPKKGHKYLLEALARLRRRGIAFHCDVAGDGPLANDLRSAVAELGLLAHVSLCGSIPHDILLSRLQENFYDVVVLASVDIADQPGEGIPVALMEAMAVGIPCVATRTGGVPELIDGALSSLVVPQRDPDALADAIANLAAHPARRADIGVAARQRIRDAFDVRLTTMQLCELMEAS